MENITKMMGFKECMRLSEMRAAGDWAGHPMASKMMQDGLVTEFHFLWAKRGN